MKENLFTQKLLRKATAQLLCLVIFLVSLGASVAAQTADILINPPTSSIQTGQSFTVDVRVDLQSGSVNAAEVHLNFNPAYLSVTNITRPSSGTFSNETIALPAAPYTAVNNTGHLEYAASIPSGSTAADFTILSITFSTPASPQTGTTSIDLQNSPGHVTRAELNGTPLPGTLTSGSVTINCTPPSGAISVASPSTCNGQPMPVRLESATGVGPFTLVINGITYSGATIGNIFANVPFPKHNLWPGNPAPDQPNNVDGVPIEVGFKFKSSQPGFIDGIRFYVPDGAVGTICTGKLWNPASPATPMAFASFSPATSGWQQVLFSKPVAVSPNTLYLASCYSSSGYYSETDNFFTSAHTNGPLTASQNGGADGSNGVYRYGEGMPVNTYNAANYGVDVIFSDNTNTLSLTSITDATGCSVSGALQSINVFSGTCSSLPVSLVSLSATPGNRKVTLRWSTASENNNKGFDVQRSNDGTQWTTIGFVPGAGNSSSVKSYSLTDNNVELRKYYYRLKQIDIDEVYKFSAIVSATLNGKAEFVLGQTYPNPTKGQTTVQFTLPQSEHVNISLYDVNGRLMKVLVNGDKDAGTHAINFNTGLLAKGVYYYKMQAGDFSDTKKLTVQ